MIASIVGSGTFCCVLQFQSVVHDDTVKCECSRLTCYSQILIDTHLLHGYQAIPGEEELISRSAD